MPINSALKKDAQRGRNFLSETTQWRNQSLAVLTNVAQKLNLPLSQNLEDLRKEIAAVIADRQQKAVSEPEKQGLNKLLETINAVPHSLGTLSQLSEKKQTDQDLMLAALHGVNLARSLEFLKQTAPNKTGEAYLDNFCTLSAESLEKQKAGQKQVERELKTSKESIEDFSRGLSPLQPEQKWQAGIMPEQEKKAVGRIETDNAFFKKKPYLMSAFLLSGADGSMQWSDHQSLSSLDLPLLSSIGKREKNQADIDMPITSAANRSESMIPIPAPLGSRLIACEIIGADNKPIKTECVCSGAGFYYLSHCPADIKTVRYRLEQISSGETALIADASWFSQPTQSFAFQKQEKTQMLLPFLNQAQTLEEKLAVINSVLKMNNPVYSYNPRVAKILSRAGDDFYSFVEALQIGQCSVFAAYAANLMLANGEKAGIVTSLLPDESGGRFHSVGHALTFAVGAEDKLILSDPTAMVDPQLEIDEKSLSEDEWRELEQAAQNEAMITLFPKLTAAAGRLKKETATAANSEGVRRGNVGNAINWVNQISLTSDLGNKVGEWNKVMNKVIFAREFNHFLSESRATGDYRKTLKLVDNNREKTFFGWDEEKIIKSHDALRYLLAFDPYLFLLRTLADELQKPNLDPEVKKDYLDWLVKGIFTKHTQIVNRTVIKTEMIRRFCLPLPAFREKLQTLPPVLRYEIFTRIVNDITDEKDYDELLSIWDLFKDTIHPVGENDSLLHDMTNLLLNAPNDKFNQYLAFYQEVIVKQQTLPQQALRQFFERTSFQYWDAARYRDKKPIDLQRVSKILCRLKPSDITMTSDSRLSFQDPAIKNILNEVFAQQIGNHFGMGHNWSSEASLEKLIEFHTRLNADFQPAVLKDQVAKAIKTALENFAYFNRTNDFVNYPPEKNEFFSQLILATSKEFGLAGQVTKLQKLMEIGVLDRDAVRTFFGASEEKVAENAIRQLNLVSSNDEIVHSDLINLNPFESPLLRAETALWQNSHLQKTIGLFDPNYNLNPQVEAILTEMKTQRPDFYEKFIHKLKNDGDIQEKLSKYSLPCALAANFPDQQKLEHAFWECFALLEIDNQKTDQNEKQRQWLTANYDRLSSLNAQTLSQETNLEKVFSEIKGTIEILNPDFSRFWETLSPRQKVSLVFLFGPIFSELHFDNHPQTTAAAEEIHLPSALWDKIPPLYYFNNLNPLNNPIYAFSSITPKAKTMAKILEKAGALPLPDETYIKSALQSLSNAEINFLPRAKTIASYFEGVGLKRLTNNAGDLYQQKEYASGDDPRLINWKTYGKTDKLWVKQAETDTKTPLSFMIDIEWLAEQKKDDKNLLPENTRRLIHLLRFVSEKQIPTELNLFMRGEKISQITQRELTEKLKPPNISLLILQLTRYGLGAKKLQQNYQKETHQGNNPFPSDWKQLQPMQKSAEVIALVSSENKALATNPLSKLNKVHRVRLNAV